MLSRPLRHVASSSSSCIARRAPRPFTGASVAAAATALKHEVAPRGETRRSATLSVWTHVPSNSLVLHVHPQEVPKSWVSPTAERVWHRTKRLKETEFRLWAEEEAAKAKSPWRRFGVYPLVGLGISAMISKELGILLLGEYMYIPIFVAAATGAYVFGRGGMEDWFKSAHAKKRGYDTDVFDWKIDLATEALSEHRSNANIIDLVKEYKQESVSVRGELNTYYQVKPKHDWRAETIRQLNQIVAKEAEDRRKVALEMQTNLEPFVVNRIKSDTALRAQVMVDAIDRVGTAQAIDYTKDPIVKLFNEYLGKYNKGPLKSGSSSSSGSSKSGSSSSSSTPSGSSAGRR